MRPTPDPSDASSCGPDRHDRPSVPPVSDKTPVGSSGPSAAWPRESSTAAVKMCDCFKCGQPVYAGLVHFCPTALPLRDLSPMGGGPNPWKGMAR